MRQTLETPWIALSLFLLLPVASQAFAASFDCDAKELKADEKVICETRALNDADVRMATTFELLTGLMPMGNRDVLRDDQSAWLKRRQDCGSDSACIGKAYEARQEQLLEGYKRLVKPL